MEASKSVDSYDRHKWTLKSPAHHTEIAKAVAVAEQERATLDSRGYLTGDVEVSAHDDQVIVSFEAQRPKNVKRAPVADQTEEE